MGPWTRRQQQASGGAASHRDGTPNKRAAVAPMSATVTNASTAPKGGPTLPPSVLAPLARASGCLVNKSASKSRVGGEGWPGAGGFFGRNAQESHTASAAHEGMQII